jgi:hypothetical protein
VGVVRGFDDGVEVMSVITRPAGVPAAALAARVAVGPARTGAVGVAVARGAGVTGDGVAVGVTKAGTLTGASPEADAASTDDPRPAAVTSMLVSVSVSVSVSLVGVDPMEASGPARANKSGITIGGSE